MEGNPHTWPDDFATEVAQYYATLPRGPYKSNEALEAARKADQQSTQRIILDNGGQSAWHAYYAITRAVSGQRTFAGKGKFSSLLKKLEAESPEKKRAFAGRLASVMELSTQNVGDSELQRGTKRYRKYPT